MDISILLLADFANVDASGKLNVIGAFNSIQARSFPYRHPQMTLVVRLVAGFTEYDQQRILRVKLWDEDRNLHWSAPDVPFRVKPPHGGIQGEHNAIFNFQLMEFKKPGRYEFSVAVDTDEKRTIPLDVVLRENQTPAEE